MTAEKIINWFLPDGVRYNKEHPRYHELYTIAGSIAMGVVATFLFPVLLIWYDISNYLWMYYVNIACNTATLLAMRYTGHYRTFNVISGITTYVIIYYWLKDSGLIYSTNICIIHMFLLGGIIADRKWGWLTVFTNIVYLCFIYYKTTMASGYNAIDNKLGSPVYALLMHCLITAFLGSFLAYTLMINEKSRIKLEALQKQKINLLDEVVRQRTEQLNSMRQTIAADFHDHTGNMLAAINRQASILQLKLLNRPDILPLAENIITNSNELYASSKDFIWNLNNDSDNPDTLFNYLMGYGQNFYNQFDISFSVQVTGEQSHEQQLNPFAALNLIYIFKEAMSNIVKHSGADEVIMHMQYEDNTVLYIISDNGTWKEPSPGIAHYGLSNIERRAKQSGFTYNLNYNHVTRITIGVPLHSYIV